jgi:DNA polymerase-3 subunit delta'
MTSILAKALPDQKDFERARVIAIADGSAGRAIALAELDLVNLEEKAIKILRQGDPTNGRRSDLALELGKRGAGDRYAAFLEILPSVIARETRSLTGAPRLRAVDAYARTRELVAIAPRLSLDPASTVFQLGGILASVADPLP